MATETEYASVKVSWEDDGKLHIETAGPGVTPDQLVIAAHHLIRTADQLLDAEQMRRAAVAPGIVPVSAIPDDLRRKDA